LRYSEIWLSDLSYEQYNSDGIVVGQMISFVNLKSAIDTTNKMAGEMHCFDATSGEIVCVEVGEIGTQVFLYLKWIIDTLKNLFSSFDIIFIHKL